MKEISLNYQNTNISDSELNLIKDPIKNIAKMLWKKSNDSLEMSGWIDYPLNYDKKEFTRIKKTAKKINETSDVLIVLGIGGSYLGSRSIIEALSDYFKKSKTEIIYAGCNLSSNYLHDLMKYIKNKDVSINVISKSGSTTETIISFIILKNYLEKRYGKKEAIKRIYITTDPENGNLRSLADKEGYESFTIPKDIGGRYSVLTAVGLLPIAVAGINIDQIMNGAKKACEELQKRPFNQNVCFKYAALRNTLYRQRKNMEILVTYEPKLHYFSEWWKQLFGESEGKDTKGIFPTNLNYTTDLHSLGQYVQGSQKFYFETTIKIKNLANDILIPKENDFNNLNYLENKTINYVQEKAMEGTIMAHKDGKVPNIIIEINELNTETMGYLIYFFMMACAISCLLIGVNPFDQPDVEKYKSNMYKLLNMN